MVWLDLDRPVITLDRAGQLSCLKQTVQTIRELHEDISSGGTDCLKQLPLVEFSQAKEHNSPKESIAIVGMACNLPMSNDLERFWRNIIDGVDAIEEVPADHWDWKKFYDKDRFASDKAISKWGGFIKNIVFNPSAYHGMVLPISFLRSFLLEN